MEIKPKTLVVAVVVLVIVSTVLSLSTYATFATSNMPGPALQHAQNLCANNGGLKHVMAPITKSRRWVFECHNGAHFYTTVAYIHREEKPVEVPK